RPSPDPRPSGPQLRRPIGGPDRPPPPSAAAPVPMSLDLSGDPGRPRARPHLGAPTMAPQPHQSSAADLRAIFGLPLRLTGVAVALSVIDQLAASLLLNGVRVGYGPFKLLWVAAVLLVVAIGVAGFRLMSSSR
ncbi:MAG TPA: hypothetical protein VLS89_08430, partial [Candidatus Nanopelagicales bacterium]|nr:hypothetical protein [Candidatus Nanopelagicales bacterium]